MSGRRQDIGSLKLESSEAAKSRSTSQGPCQTASNLACHDLDGIALLLATACPKKHRSGARRFHDWIHHPKWRPHLTPRTSCEELLAKVQTRIIFMACASQSTLHRFFRQRLLHPYDDNNWHFTALVCWVPAAAHFCRSHSVNSTCNTVT